MPRGLASTGRKRKQADVDKKTFIPLSDKSMEDLLWWKEDMEHVASSAME